MFLTLKKINYSKMTRFAKISCFILCCTHSCAYALLSDNQEKLMIISDASNTNYKNGITIFEGNVKVDQGTTHIRADRLTTKTDKHNKIIEAIAYGLKNTAHYWTKPDKDQEQLHARANIIKYYPVEGNITLEQNVFVQQNKNSFQGQIVLYNINSQTISVPASKNGRAVLVYNPN